MHKSQTARRGAVRKSSTKFDEITQDEIEDLIAYLFRRCPWSGGGGGGVLIFFRPFRPAMVVSSFF